LNELNGAIERFSEVLSVSASVLTQLAIGTSGQTRAVALLHTSSPTELRETIMEIGATVSHMKTPQSRTAIRQKTLGMLDIARTAASNFEKLMIMDQYSPNDARRIIQSAYMQMYQARNEQRKIQSSLAHPTADTRPAGVQRVVSSEGY
jgi:hypothetical protein